MNVTSELNGLVFATMNINGASKHEKQKDIFDFFRQKKLDIIFLQETHWKSEQENLIRSIWGYNCFLCGNSSASKGVAILFRNSFEYKIHKIIKDDERGSFLVLDISIFNTRLTLCNIYGPSEKDDQDFFIKVFDVIRQVGNEQVITTGDWNVILEPNIDARNYLSFNNKPKSRKILKDVMTEFDLVDIYRKVYPTKRIYTWRRFNTIKQSRLDYFLISDALSVDILNVDIQPGYRTDHSLVTIMVKNGSIKEKCKGYWKFNNSLLYEKKYIDIVKLAISKIKKQYAALVYKFENINEINDNDLHFTINDQLFFEMLMLEIRGQTISFASQKKKNEDKLEKKLFDEIKTLEKDEHLNQDSVINLEHKKIQLQEIREKKIRGMMIRSRLQWLQHGEKPSRYFCSLESRNFSSKRMCFLINEKGDTLFEQEELVQETKMFYKNLYDKKDIIEVDLDDIINVPKKLNDNERDSLEGEITLDEAKFALKNMKNNRSPGNSGFTSEFFKFFLSDIGVFLIRSINYGFRCGKLSITQRQGVITCIPKEGKNVQYLSNWRPISLLNVSYKIASACISNRIKQVLDKILSDSQKGFLANKTISENIQLMYDILTYTEKEQIPGMLLLIDFHKAFDSISWTFIDKTLKFFNFGEDIIRWVKTFYTDITSCVSVNGRYSEYFDIMRGVRQGDPLSPYLFLLCAEILSYLLKENENIKSLKIKDKEAFLSQFADDTAVYLDGSKESFEQCIRNLLFFANISGLTMNYEKTAIIWLGSKKNSSERFMRDRNFLWDPGGPNASKFRYLGIYFSTDIDSIIELNFHNKLEQIEKIFKVWSKRSLTPYGKITVIKTLALSKLTYILTNLPDPETIFLKRLETLIFNFLWDNKPGKISKNHMYLSKDKGGFDMVNVFDYVSFLKINLFRKIFHNNELLFAMYPSLSKIGTLGSEFLDRIICYLPNKLWQDIIKHVKKLIIKKQPETFDDFTCEFIFCNINILIDKEIVLYKEWQLNNICQIKQILNEDGTFFTYEMFKNKFPMITTNFLNYYGLINAIKRYMKCLKINPEEIQIVQEKPIGWRVLSGSKNDIKEELKSQPIKHTSKIKWETSFTNLNWERIYKKCNRTTADVKMKWFQMRILYRTLPTNRLLFLKKIKESSICNFCNNDEQTLTHLFWDCPIVQSFWDSLKNSFVSKLPHVHDFNLSKELVIFGTKENVFTDTPLDLFILLAKYHIYVCKMSDAMPNQDIFLKLFKQKYNLEKHYNDNGTKLSFQQKWISYEGILNSI